MNVTADLIHIVEQAHSVERILEAATRVIASGCASLSLRREVRRDVASARGETTSLLASPMLLRDGMVGALVLHSTARRAFSAEDIGTLATTGAHSASSPPPSPS